jgi:ABC-type transport system involved in multi-copper enzyme maturation permease subunit
MTSALAILTGSVRQLFPLRRSIALVGLQVAPAILFLFASNDKTPDAGFQIFVEVSTVAFFFLVLPIIAIVLGSTSLGVERRDQTLSFIALRPISRRMVALIKILAAAIAAFAFSIVGVFLLVLMYVIRFGFDSELFVGIAIGALVAVVAYSCMFVPLGFITDRAVIIGLAYLLIFENGVVAALPGLASLSPARLGASMFGAVVTSAQVWIEGVAGSLAFSAGSAVFVLMVYAVIGIVLTAYLVSKRDLA